MGQDDDTTNETADTPEPVVEKIDLGEVEPEEAARVEDFAQTFKTAAQKVLEERFGMEQNADGTVDFTKIDSDKVKANAQALITGLMSQLAGVTAPQTEATGAADAEPATSPDPDDNVIDLEAARRARAPRERSELEQRISQGFKQTLDTYMKEHFVPEGTEGRVDLTVDGEMLKEHGPQLLTALFGAFTKSIFPEDGVQVSLGGQQAATEEPGDPEAEGEPTEETDTSSDTTGSVDVKINVDLAGMFRGLLDSVKPKS